ncbi:MAG: recombination protein, partial [Pseudomonadota bacterium]
MKSSPKSFEALVEALQALPALGRKSAIKLAYHLLIENPTLGVRLAHSIEQGLYNIKKCKICGNVAEHELCEVCADDERDDKILCIV